MPKIALIGAGSIVFAKGLTTDILSYPALASSHIALMDIDAQNLRITENIARRIVAAGKHDARITATTNRVQAVRDADFPPEGELDLKASYKSGRRTIQWRPSTRKEITDNGYLDFIRLLGPLTDAAVYVAAGIRSGSNQKLNLLLGSDDGAAVWINGKRIFHQVAARSAMLDQERISLPLRKGNNLLLTKVDQKVGHWGLLARLGKKPSDVKFLSTQ